MNTPGQYRPTIAQLYDLHLRLVARVEKLDGSVKQLLVERTRDTTLLPTWKDVQELRADIDRLQKKIDELRK
jgi:polyhydroxyalkanoate synthesis regulator phasin